MTRKLCIITSSYAFGRDDGAASAGVFVRDFAAAVAEQGHQVTVLTQRTSAADAEPETSVPGQSDSQPGVNVRTFDWSGGRRPLASLRLSRLRDAWLMLRLMRNGGRALAALHAEQNFDHLLAMWAVPAGVWARQLQRSGGVPYTVWCLGSDIWTYGKLPVLRWIVGRVLRAADHVFADGLQLAEDAERLAGREVRFLASSRRLVSAGGGEETPPAAGVTGEGEAAGDASGVPPPAPPLPRGGNADAASGPRFLFLGRYEPVKGVDVLLEAMAMFARRHPTGHLQLLGGGSLEATIRDRVAQPDLQGRVSVGGYADAATAVAHLHACHVVVIPSRMESIPIVLSDAVQLGRPVIVTDVGDMGRLLRETPAGLFVPPEDPAALCHAMEEIDRRPRGDLAAACSELAAKFDIQQVARQWLEAVATTTRR